MSNEPEHYDSTSIVLHWITAVLVAVSWVLAHYIDDFPRGPARVNARSAHILLGILLVAILIYRVYWRARNGRALPPINIGIIAKLTKAGHMALYVLLALTLLLGVADTFVRGDNLFNAWTIPSVAPGNRVLRRQVGELHELASNVILIVASIHALIALLHHFFLHDATLRRMWPRTDHSTPS